jgi:hypothetical protein
MGDAEASTRIRERLDRAANLLRCAAARSAPTLDDDEALRREAARLRPRLEALVGREYGRLPRVRYRRALGARLAGPWSQYLTLGHGATRLVLMTPLPSSRLAIPTILAHELAHRYSFDESLTTLRGLEVSARLAEEGDPMHALSAPRELARTALGAAMAEAVRVGCVEEVERFLEQGRADPALARSRAGWERLQRRRGRRRPAECITTVYAAIPCAALEGAAASGAAAAGPLPHPRFPIRSLQGAAIALYTAADAVAGRRRAPVPLQATLRLWSGAA